MKESAELPRGKEFEKLAEELPAAVLAKNIERVRFIAGIAMGTSNLNPMRVRQTLDVIGVEISALKALHAAMRAAQDGITSLLGVKNLTQITRTMYPLDATTKLQEKLEKRGEKALRKKVARNVLQHFRGQKYVFRANTKGFTKEYAEFLERRLKSCKTDEERRAIARSEGTRIGELERKIAATKRKFL